MINPKAAVGNGSRLSCHNMPKTLGKQVFYMLSLESHNHADSYLVPIVEDMAEIGIQVWQVDCRRTIYRPSSRSCTGGWC